VRARRAGGHLHGPRPRSTGLLPQELEAAPPLATQLEALAAWVAGDVLVVHVAAVDLAFLDAALGRTWGVPLPSVVLGQLRRVAGV
jgi:DNA polymerase III epsilon subunit-like protein